MMLSIVIPVHNEQDNIGPLIEEITGLHSHLTDYEIIVVDDGSDDATVDRTREKLSADVPLRIIRLKNNSGQSFALATGIREARGGWIATLDGDGQNDPRDILKLLKNSYTVVACPEAHVWLGNRTERHDVWSKRIASTVGNKVRGLFLGDETPDSGCGIKLFSRDLFIALPYFDHMHRFLPALFMRHGAILHSISVSHRARRSGESHYSNIQRLCVGIVDLLGVYWLMHRMKTSGVCSSKLDK